MNRNNLSIRLLIAAILAAFLLTACGVMEPPDRDAGLSSPDSDIVAGQAGGAPPVFDEGVMAEIESEQGGGGDAPVTVEEGEPGYEVGIHIMGVGFRSAGYMMNFRYVVVDPERSMPMFDRQVKPYLLHEKSGAIFMVPSPAKLGPMRATTREPEKGKRYYIMFTNPGRYVKQGDLVTVVVGDYRFEHLPVQ